MARIEAWWRHQMETFSALLALCEGNSPVTGEFPAQRSVTRDFDVSFDVSLNNRLSKQWWGWWFETPSYSLWRHCNESGRSRIFHTDANSAEYGATQDEVIKWKHFPRYWPPVRGIHRSPVNSPHKGQWRGALKFSLICALNKRLSKQS